MPSTLRRRTKSSQAAAGLETWKLEDAKARLSEVVRRAETQGPQLVTVRGREAAVILASEQYRQHLPKPKGHHSLVRFLQELELSGIEVKREMETGRDIRL